MKCSRCGRKLPTVFCETSKKEICRECCLKRGEPCDWDGTCYWIEA